VLQSDQSEIITRHVQGGPKKPDLFECW